MEAISLAGGLGQWANPKKIQVIRKEGAEEKNFIIDYRDVLEGINNIPIYPGDKIIVP